MPIFWTDFHSNIHHDQMKDLDKWIAQIRETLDFWPIAYYPFGMRKDSTGLGVEDTIPMESIKVDWEVLREAVKKVNEEGFPMFMGYEWQGNGLDGDHNVFFKTNDEDPCFVLDYHKLIENYDGIEAIGIPHHTAYQLKNRGKDWDRQNDTFSPFAEIYSSHGSSECDDNWINMDRHVHMGPRTDATSVSTGLKKGNHFGLIASGDNHSCPGVYGFGYAAVVSKDNSKEEIWKALKLVNAEFVIDKMDKGLDSEVGEGGDMLSTGEKQLISFARAILADPKILVLDEATASIDTLTEKAIQDAIFTVIKGRTSFVIAHRLSTIVDADVILVVKDGKIIERGKHAELMQAHGYYYDLYTRQYEEMVTNTVSEIA